MNQKSPNPSYRKVLIAEDADANRILMCRILEDVNIECIQAKDGVEAYELYISNRDIGLIFMDMQMPVMNGIDSALKIRQWEITSGLPVTPIIGLTAFNFITDIQNCLKAGMNDVLNKPIDVIKLSSILQKYILPSDINVSFADKISMASALEILEDSSEMVFNANHLKNVVKGNKKLARIMILEVLSMMPTYLELMKELILNKSWDEVQSTLMIINNRVKEIGSVRLSKMTSSLIGLEVKDDMFDIRVFEKLIFHFEQFEKELQRWVMMNFEQNS